MNKDELNKLKNNVKNYSVDDLVNIENISIDKKSSASDSLRLFLNDINNPYIFKYKDTVIRVRFNNDCCSLSELLTKYFIHLKSE